MKILITGGAGAIGSHLSEAFARTGQEVITIDNLNGYYDTRIKKLNLRDLKREGVHVIEGDLNAHDLSLLGDDVDAIFHFAAQPGISSATTFSDYIDNNIYATNALLAYALRLPKLRAFVHISTSSVYGAQAVGDEGFVPQPTSPYGITKLAAEQLSLSKFRSDGLPVTSLRLFSVFGPRERPEKLYHKLIRSILEGKEFPLHSGSAEHTRSFTYVGDIIDACVRALEHIDDIKGEIINIGSNEVHSTREGIEMIERITGKKANIVLIPPRYGDQRDTKASIEKASKLLGFAPKTSFEEGLLQQYLWQKDHLFPNLMDDEGLA